MTSVEALDMPVSIKEEEIAQVPVLEAIAELTAQMAPLYCYVESRFDKVATVVVVVGSMRAQLDALAWDGRTGSSLGLDANKTA